MTTNNIDVEPVSAAPCPITAESMDAVEAVRLQLQSGSKLLTAAALALRAETGDEARDGVRGIVGAAKTTLVRALDGIETSRQGKLTSSDELGRIEESIYNLYGSLLVVEFALKAEEPIGVGDIDDHPVADALDVAGDALGRDSLEGLNGQLNELTRALSKGEKLQ